MMRSDATVIITWHWTYQNAETYQDNLVKHFVLRSQYRWFAVHIETIYEWNKKIFKYPAGDHTTTNDQWPKHSELELFGKPISILLLSLIGLLRQKQSLTGLVRQSHGEKNHKISTYFCPPVTRVARLSGVDTQMQILISLGNNPLYPSGCLL